MKTCKRIFLPFFFMLVVTGCANVASTVPTSSPIATGTIASTLISITPTVAARPTPTPVAAEIDPAADPSTWSADVQARFHDVLTSPNAATDQEKADYDAFMIVQWQRVAGAEGKTGYDLINAMVDYAKQNKIQEVAPLPFSIQLQIVSDPTNMVAYGVGSGMNPNPRSSHYGIGFDGSPYPTVDQMRQDSALFFPKMHFFGSTIQSDSSKIFNMTVNGLEGDLVLRFDLQGKDPNVSQGGLIQMIDQSGHIHYALVVINYQATKTTTAQDCITLSGSTLSGGACAGGDALKATTMNLISKPTDHKSMSRKALDDLMSQTDNALHVAVHTGISITHIFNVFDNGSTTATVVEIASDVKMP